MIRATKPAIAGELLAFGGLIRTEGELALATADPAEAVGIVHRDRAGVDVQPGENFNIVTDGELMALWGGHSCWAEIQNGKVEIK